MFWPNGNILKIYKDTNDKDSDLRNNIKIKIDGNNQLQYIAWSYTHEKLQSFLPVGGSSPQMPCWTVDYGVKI